MQNAKRLVGILAAPVLVLAVCALLLATAAYADKSSDEKQLPVSDLVPATMVAQGGGDTLAAPAKVYLNQDSGWRYVYWTRVEGATSYDITVNNTSSAYPLSKTYHVDGSSWLSSTKAGYDYWIDLQYKLPEATVQTGINPFYVTVVAKASGKTDSAPTDSNTHSYNVKTFISNLAYDESTGQLKWDPYYSSITKYYHVECFNSSGKLLADCYQGATTIIPEKWAEKYGKAKGSYRFKVTAMTEQASKGGKALTEPTEYKYDYTPQVKTISISGVTQPVVGGLAQVYLGDLSVAEEHASLPKDGDGYGYWRKKVWGSWEALEPLDKFAAGNEYRVSIPVLCDKDYTFAKNPKVFINGQEVTATVEEIGGVGQPAVRVEADMALATPCSNVYVVTAGSLNVRSAPTANSNRVGGLKYGDVVEAKAQVGGFTMFAYNGKDAWVDTKYLALTESKATAFEGGPVYYETAATLNVRSTPEALSDLSNRIGEIAAHGHKVLATGLRVMSDGKTWITMDYYKESEPEKGHRLGYMLFSYPSGSGVYNTFTTSETPPTKSPAKVDDASPDLAVDTGTYPKITFEWHKKSIATDTGTVAAASLTDGDFINKGDGYVLTTVYPGDGENFATLTADKVKLPAVFTELDMVVLDLVHNADGSVQLKIGPKTPVTYTVSKGGDATWTKGSGAGIDLTANRSSLDDFTFAQFVGLEIDGVEVDPANYEATHGSLNVTFAPAFLETLSAGTHTVKAIFKDGSVETTLTVKAAPAPEKEQAGTAAASTKASKIPAAGDTIPVGLPCALALVALIGLVFMRAQNVRANRR